MKAFALAVISLMGGAVALHAQPAPERKFIPPDPKAVAERAAAIKDGKLRTGNALFLVLREMPGDQTTTLAALIQLRDDPKLDSRELTEYILGLGGESPLVFPVILNVLEKEEQLSHIRQNAVKGLAKQGQRGLPVLFGVLKTAKADDMGKDAGVRAAALWALENLDVYKPDADLRAMLAALRPAFKHDAADVRAAVVAGLGRMQILEKGQRASHPALAELLAALKDADPKVREVAAKMLGQFRGTGDNEKIIPDLLELTLNNKRQDDAQAAPRWFAIHALVSMGDQGIKPLLESDWGGGDRRVAIQGAFVQALAASRYKSTAALPFLLDNIGDQHVLYALAHINYGEAAKSAIPELTALLTNQREYQRVWALEALFTVGPNGPPAAVQALKTNGSEVRTAILNRLQKAEFRAKEAVPALIDCLEDKSATVRALSAERLGAIGPDARAALPALDLLLDDPDASVRAAAHEAMKRIKR